MSSKHLLLALEVGLGAACLFCVSEQDIFWQLRAGDALWQTGVFPTQDTWTFTVPGAPWRNLEWLGTLLMRATFGLGGVAAWVVARGLCVALLCHAWSVTARRAGASYAQAAVLTALLWTAALPRLQLRPELFVLLLHSALGALWLGPCRTPVKCAVTVAGALLAANLHPGVAPLLCVSALTWLLPQRAWGSAAVCAFAPLCTPNGLYVVPFLWEHMAYFAAGGLPNPDHQPVTIAYTLSPSGLAALSLIATGATATAMARGTSRPPLSSIAAATLLAAIAMERTRAVPFACTAILPLAAAFSLRRAPCRLGGLLAGFALTLWAAAPLVSAWGLGIDSMLMPQKATAYLSASRPHARLLHNYMDGAYLVWARRDAPLFIDTRETLFYGLEAELQQAFASAEGMESLVRKYHIDTVLLPIPNDLTGALRRIFPAEHWPMLYFDATRLVLGRADTPLPPTYHWLDPNMPANAYAHSAARTPQTDATVQSELERCLREDRANPWCLIARGALRRAQGLQNAALADFAAANAFLSPQAAQRAVLADELRAARR